MSILILVYVIIYSILAKLRLDWAVMFLIAALPSYLIRFKILGIPFTLLETMILISFMAWFLFHTKFSDFLKGKYGWHEFKESKKKRINYPFGLEISLLLIISFIAVAVSGFSNAALGTWKAYFFEPVLVFILILNLFKGKNGFNKISWSLAISALVISVIAVYQKFTGAWIINDFWAARETRRVTSFFGYPNAVGLYLGPIVFVLMGWIMGQMSDIKKRVISYKLYVILTVIVLSIISIYFAKSEGALIAVIVGIIVFCMLAGKRIRWVTIVLIIVVGAGIMAYAPAREYTVNKITLNDLSGQIRRQQWRETLEMLKDESFGFAQGGRIVTGTGLANYQAAIASYHQEGIFFNKDNDPDFRRKIVLFSEEFKKKYWQPVEVYLYPHNIFLNFWTELGIGGMLLFIWLIAKYFAIGIRLLRNQKFEISPPSLKLRRINNLKFENYIIAGLVGAMVVVVVHGIVDVPYFKNDLSVMFWVLVAMMSFINLGVKSEKLE